MWLRTSTPLRLSLSPLLLPDDHADDFSDLDLGDLDFDDLDLDKLLQDTDDSAFDETVSVKPVEMPALPNLVAAPATLLRMR